MTSESEDISPRRSRFKIAEGRLVLTESGLDALKNHQFKAGNYTVVDNFLNKYLWTPAVEFLPMSMAPNLVTLVGLFFVLSAFSIQTYYSTDLGEKDRPPGWVNIICGVHMFIYQTLDCIDGKQARRTGSSSPLGQLFDHGVDAVAVTPSCMMTFCAMGTGFNMKSAYALLFTQLSFWSAQWAEYYTHRLDHSQGGIGTTEAQLLSIGICISAGIFGTEIFQTPIPEIIPGVTRVADVFCLFGIVVAFSIAVSAAVTVTTTSTGDRFTAWVQTIPIFILVIIGPAWQCMPVKYPYLVVGTCGLVFCHLTMWMVLCSMTQMHYPTYPTIIIPMPILFALKYTETLSEYSDLLLAMYFSYALHKTYKFLVYTEREITSFLKIDTFTIPHKPKDKDK